MRATLIAAGFGLIFSAFPAYADNDPKHDPWYRCPEKVELRAAAGEPDFYLLTSTLILTDADGKVTNDLMDGFFHDKAGENFYQKKSKEELAKGKAELSKTVAWGLGCRDLPKQRFFVDVNFDGYKDILLSYGTAILANTLAEVWLYNPDTKRFEFSDEFDGKIASDVAINPKTQLLMTNNACCAGLSRTNIVYRWQSGKIVKVKTCNMDKTSKNPKKHKDNLAICSALFDPYAKY